MPSSCVQPGRMQIFCKVLSGRTKVVLVRTDETVFSLMCKVQTMEGILVCQFNFFFAGKKLEEKRVLSDYNIQTESTVHLALRLVGGKPVIYLFPPLATTNVHVQLSLANSWEFPALYPATPVTTDASRSIDSRQSVAWTVDAKPYGTLFDHLTRREVSYLFWEAHTKPTLPTSPAYSRPGSPIQKDSVGFDPARPIITPENSVLLPLDKVTAYIDDALMLLGLHTEARCSFITYWLPNLQRHTHIALRFLPQTEYAAAAPMKVTPTPDVTTRVFMLFRGVEESELGLWVDAEGRANKHPSLWQDIVGVDAAKAHDVELFRVLERGGMEIK